MGAYHDNSKVKKELAKPNQAKLAEDLNAVSAIHACGQAPNALLAVEICRLHVETDDNSEAMIEEHDILLENERR